MPDNHRSSLTSPATALSRIATALLIVSPLVAVAISVPLLWGHAVHVRDLVLAAILYAITGHGVTIGFHRLFTHRGFTPKRAELLREAFDGHNWYCDHATSLPR